MSKPIARKFIPVEQVIAYGREQGITEGGVCACVDVTNMGFMKDGTSRWYHFEMNGEACYTIKR